MRKPIRRGSGFGRPHKKPQPPAAPRNHSFEAVLCEAIGRLRRVRLKYEDDVQWRTYEPHCVHFSPKDAAQVNVFGFEQANPNKFDHKPVLHSFEIGMISAVEITDTQFTRDPHFDRLARLFRNGIICSI